MKLGRRPRPYMNIKSKDGIFATSPFQTGDLGLKFVLRLWGSPLLLLLVLLTLLTMRLISGMLCGVVS